LAISNMRRSKLWFSFIQVPFGAGKQKARLKAFSVFETGIKHTRGTTQIANFVCHSQALTSFMRLRSLTGKV
ncbi:MAG: hypothetical protein J6R40_02440, partial [Clostridia bacterium]|nr:hypothetical protein [Clostridia bacterium]